MARNVAAIHRGGRIMVDYLGANGAITTAETTVRVGGGGSIGAFDATALTLTATSSTNVEIYGSIWGTTGIRTSTNVDITVRVFAGGSIAGRNGSAITGRLRVLSNEGNISGSVDVTAANFVSQIYNYGTISNYYSSSLNIRSVDSRFFNAGSVIGFGNAMIYTGSGGHRLDNSGSISATTEGIGNFGSTIEVTNGVLALTNTGRISADSGSIAVVTAGGADVIVNHGQIAGNVSLAGGNDRYDGSLGTLAGSLSLGTGNDTASAGGNADEINGNEDDDTLSGNGGDDLLDGGAGNDILDGGSGNDRMIGGGGDDRYTVDSARDVVIEAADGGTDTVITLISYTLRSGQAIEALTASGEEGLLGLALIGNAIAQTITGDAGDNRITGGGGADTLIGLAGDDTYIVTDSDTIVTEAANGGSDTIVTSTSFTLSADVETLRASGSDRITLVGNDLDNLIVGNAGANVISGGAGADRMVGGLGNDIYYVENTGDVVADSGGADTVRTIVDYTLGKTIETLILDGAGDIDGIGNGLANTIIGNAGANVLSGRGGLDTLTGGGGADSFLFATKAAAGSLATITDFLGGTDIIALDDGAFRRIGGPGALNAAFFTDGPATIADHHILYDAATGTLSYDADGSGARYDAVAFAQVTAGTMLTAADIVIV